MDFGLENFLLKLCNRTRLSNIGHTRGEMSNTYTFNFSTRGYHVYKDILEATVRKQLSCCKEPHNVHDVYAVAVVEEKNIVGHAPRLILPVCNLFITRGGTIDYEIIGPRRYSVDLPQGGLELPCKLFSGSSKDITKVEDLLKSTFYRLQ